MKWCSYVCSSIATSYSSTSACHLKNLRYYTVPYVTPPPDTAATATLVREREVIKRALIQVFSASWDLYIKTQKDNELCLYLKKKAKEALQVQATEEAAMEVDIEVPASQQQLRDLIQREATKVADKRINALKQELATIKKLVLAKNTGRGQTSKGASTKRKKQDGKRPNDQSGTDGTVVPTHRSEDSYGGKTTSGNSSSRRNPQRKNHARSHGGRTGGRPRDSRGGRDDNTKRRSTSRSRNRDDAGGRRSNRSSR
jgi:hypothetical protein